MYKEKRPHVTYLIMLMGQSCSCNLKSPIVFLDGNVAAVGTHVTDYNTVFVSPTVPKIFRYNSFILKLTSKIITIYCQMSVYFRIFLTSHISSALKLNRPETGFER